VEKFIRTFYNGNYDSKFDDKLNNDQGVTIARPRPTQASYNKPDNWRERNRTGLTNLKRQLQTCIDSMKNDTSFNLDLNYFPIWINNEEPILWHEPIVDRYWDVLEEEIDRRKQKEIVTDIKHLQIMNIEMKEERLASLVAMFVSGRATNSSTQFFFSNTNICEEGFIWLSKLIEVSSTLECFCLEHNWIDNMESARCLSRTLKSHTRINQLWLSHCDLGNSPEILSIILQSDVKIIHLDNNNINSLGAVKIAEYLESNPPMQRIYLNHNRLNDDDAILISQALKRNTDLILIDIHSNCLSSIGVKALLGCVFDSSSLNAISESNHTLVAMTIFKECRMGKSVRRLLRMDRTQKIVLALQDKDSLLKYLANVPVKLMPEVLAFPRGQIVDEHKHKHLNIVYSTMRWWNMPLLYSYYSCV
jgi:hypothetical protein